jgi:molecular chaperone GrpE
MFGKPAEETKDKSAEGTQISGEETVETTPATEPEEPLTELEEAKKEALENYDRYLRISAEFDNYKKRVQKDRTDLLNYGNERLIKELLPIIDSMERALSHLSNAEDIDAFAEGLKLIYEQLLVSLKKHGVESIAAIGQEFDPNFHEAMMKVESDEIADNKIVEEFEKGYLLNGRLLRPSKVSIAQHVKKGKKKK